MARWLAALVAVIVLPTPRGEAVEPVRVACVGDSITAGVGTRNPSSESYPAQLQALLGRRYRVGNFGHSGATLTRRTTRPYWSQPQYASALEFEPQIVVIMLGTNDAVPDRWNRVKDDFVPTLKEMIETFRSLPGEQRVFVCLPVPSFESRKQNVEVGVVPLVRQAGRESGVDVIDLFHPFENRQELFPDRLHPDASGAALMAAIVHHAVSDPMRRKRNWKLVSADSEEAGEGTAVRAFDGRPDTYWHTAYSKSVAKHPHELVIDLGEVHNVMGVSYLPRQSGVNGRVRDFELLANTDPSSPGAPVAKGAFTGRTDEKIVWFARPVELRYLTFRALSEINQGPWTSVAELDVLSTASVGPASRPAEERAAPPSATTRPSGPFQIGATDFLLDGRPFVIRSGEMHVARVPRPYWRHRLDMIRAMGCNTVCAYLFWNQHEPRSGEFDFSGQADIAAYCHLARQAGLKVILRPGPYSCAEWDLGGLPSWLLRHADIKLRTRDPRYVAALRRYLLRVGRELAPLQITRRGPIIMVQVENEYGSYGNDKEYIGLVRDALREAGFDVPMFTCDGPSQLPNATRDDLFCAVNFGSNPEQNFKALRAIRPSGPLMVSEYYPGWFDSWGRRHHFGDTPRLVRDIEYMLAHRCSFSLYMVHGGTSFGFFSGANSPPYSPQTTSYDYDAPIDEAGRATPKYHALRKLILKHLSPGETLPPVPPPNAVIAIPPIRLTEVAPILDGLGPPVRVRQPQPMEMFDQAHGCILYRTTFPAGPKGTLRIVEPHDFAQVYLDGRRVGVLDRRHRGRSVALPARTHPGQLDILIEAMGRVNYGGDFHDRKGITERVEWQDGTGVAALVGWEVFTFALDEPFLRTLRYRSAERPLGDPAIYRGRFELTDVGDSFLDTRGWEKGMVWVNGHNLGRYWAIGPQQTLYVPGCWLNRGVNEILVLDITGATERLEMAGVEVPILDELRPDPLAPKPLRPPGQSLNLVGLDPVFSGQFADARDWQLARFEPARGRFVCVEAIDSHAQDPFTTCAEIVLLNERGEPLAMDDIRVVYADSEELAAENGSAANVLDGDPLTYWHTEWNAAQPIHPHRLVLDLGCDVVLSGLRMLPRQDSPNGRIATLRIFVSDHEFPEIK